MRETLTLLLTVMFLCPTLAAQSAKAPADAAKSIQPAQGSATKNETSRVNGDGLQAGALEIKIPAGTPLDIEAAHTVNSSQVQPGDLISFRVLIPIKISDVTVIEKGALVTGRVIEAKRGGHWGRAGRLAWTIQDVIAADGTSIPVRTENELAKDAGRTDVRGTSHGKEVATKTIVAGALLAPVFPIAPLALMEGFKRGENAILPAGKRFAVFVNNDTTIRVTPGR